MFDATIVHQAFSHDRCIIFPYKKANDTFLNSLRRNGVEAQVELYSSRKYPNPHGGKRKLQGEEGSPKGGNFREGGGYE